jgi:heparanase
MRVALSASIIKVCILLLLFACSTPRELFSQQPSNVINVKLSGLKSLGKIDERYQSFNIEMVEVVGGKFWIPFDQIDTTKRITGDVVVGETKSLYRALPPINLYEKKLRMLASALGPTYMRVSGTWANSTYFQDNDEAKLTNPPAGYKNVLSRKEWKGVVDFSKAVGAKLVTSFAISAGVRDKDSIWTPVQAQALVNYTKSIGSTFAAAELFNEPTHAAYGYAPEGYNATTFAKDFAVFKNFVKSSIPDMIVLGPGSTGEGGIFPATRRPIVRTEDLLSANPKPVFDVFSYHYYGAVSKRCAPDGGPGSISPDDALSPEWLNKTVKGYNFYKGMRDKYLPGKPIWLTETADAACGGNPWGATFLDCFRYVEQLGKLAKEGVQVVIHNTLSASEYGLLEQETFEPRPNYWTAFLWSRFMGTNVYDAPSTTRGVDMFVHSLKNKPGGRAVLIVNTLSTASSVNIPSNAEQFMLTASELETRKVQLNGEDLALTANDELPVIKGKRVKAGVIQIPAHSITYLTFARTKK